MVSMSSPSTFWRSASRSGRARRSARPGSRGRSSRACQRSSAALKRVDRRVGPDDPAGNRQGEPGSAGAAGSALASASSRIAGGVGGLGQDFEDLGQPAFPGLAVGLGELLVEVAERVAEQAVGDGLILVLADLVADVVEDVLGKAVGRDRPEPGQDLAGWRALRQGDLFQRLAGFQFQDQRRVSATRSRGRSLAGSPYQGHRAPPSPRDTIRPGSASGSLSAVRPGRSG